MSMQQDWTPEREIEFFRQRLAQEEAAARSDSAKADVHAQLARDYSAALAAYQNLAVNR
jgi:hypothetical protein